MHSHHFVDLVVLPVEEGKDLLDELWGVDGLLGPLDHGVAYQLLEGGHPVLLLPLLGLSVHCEDHLAEQLGQRPHPVSETGVTGCVGMYMYV